MRRAPVLLSLLFAWGLLLFPRCSPAQGLRAGPARPTPNLARGPVSRLIVKFKDPVEAKAPAIPSGKVRAFSGRAGVALRFHRKMSGNAHLLALPRPMTHEEAREAAAAVAADPSVEYAEPDARMFPMVVPDDTLYSLQWHYGSAQIAPGGANVEAAWDVTKGNASLAIAVLDTGYVDHGDLSPRIVGGYDLISLDPAGAGPNACDKPAADCTANDGGGRDADAHDPGDWITASEDAGTDNGGWYGGCGQADSSWHGTHVGGTIGAMTNNSIGVAGVNWNSKVVPVRVLGKCGGNLSDIADGIRWAAGVDIGGGVPVNANPAKVINLSLGGDGDCGATYQNAVNEVTGSPYFATVVVSAGNDNKNTSLVRPGNCAGVITVAAVGRNGERAPYSNFGSGIEISAPGGNMASVAANGVGSTLNSGTQGPVATPGGDAYVYYQGTSMSAPHVSGIASLMLSVNANLTPAQVVAKMQSSARAFPTGTGNDCTTSLCGPGIINAYAAVLAAGTPPTASAGVDQVVVFNQAVTLDGTGSSDDGSIASYAWAQTQGPAVTLAGAGTSQASFTANKSGVLVFKLTVTDDVGLASVDYSTVTVNINAPAVVSAATLGVSSLAWSWGAVSGAASYNIYFATNPSYLIANSAGNSRNFTGLQANTTFSMVVYGVRDDGVNGPGAVSPTTATLAALPSPGATSIHITSATVAFTPSASASGYLLMTSTASDFSGTIFSSATNNGAVAVLQVSGLSASTSYYLRLGSVNKLGGAYMSAAGLPAPIFTNTSVTAPVIAAFGGVTKSEIRLNWSQGANPSNLAYRAEASQDPTFVAGVSSQTGTDIFTALFGGLSPNASYYFRVWGQTGPSASTGPVATLGLSPSTATPIFSAVFVTSVTANWTSGGNPAGTRYEIQLSSAADFLGVQISSAGTTGVSATFVSLAADTSYYARVRAVGHGGAASPIEFLALGSTATLAVDPAHAAPYWSSVSSAGLSVILSAGANPAGTAFTVQISSAAGFTTVTAQASGVFLGATATASVAGLDSNWKYYSRVRAANRNGIPTSWVASGLSTATFPAPPAAAASSDQVFISSVTRGWTLGPNKTGTTFEVRTATDPAFGTLSFSETTGGLTSSPTPLSPNTTHYTQVRALTLEAGNPPSAWVDLSPRSTLVVAAPAAASPFLSVTYTSATVVWTPLAAAPQSAAAEGYLLTLSTSPNFGGELFQTTVWGGSVGQAGVAGLRHSTSYYLRIGSLNWEGLQSFANFGSTATLIPQLSSKTVNGATTLTVVPPYPQAQSLQLEVPAGALPAGTSLELNANVEFELPPLKSNQAAMTSLGDGVGLKITSNAQPLSPVAIVMKMILPPGTNLRRLALARFDEASGQWTLLKSHVDAGNAILTGWTNHFSFFAPFLVDPGSNVLDVNIFPIPWEPGSNDSLHNSPVLTFTKLPAEARVRIYNITGELVDEVVAAPNGVLAWEGTNRYGRKAGSGTYLALIEAGGQRAVRRFVLIR